ncbi:MAG: FadR family transcriptional regulator [Spirochaetaceae bacterium]|nr:MAG: FadR family transcriptional regulator [Spirochaetaceae bacterium]
MFRQVVQNRIFQDVSNQIEEAILKRRLKAGDKLPAERELQETFKISRGTLREALRVLEQKGLISIRTGAKGGAVIKAVTTEPASDSLSFLFRYHKVSLHDLAEFREGVEGNVSALAAERATEEDIRRLQGLLSEAEKITQQGPSRWDEFISTDNQLHMELARIARNPVYETVLHIVHDNIKPYYDSFLPRSKKMLRENYQDLCGIVKAVEEGRASEARLLAQAHVDRFRRFMEKREHRRSGSL